MVARRKPTARSADAAANKENEVNGMQGFSQQMLDQNHLHAKVEKKHSAAESCSEQDDCSALSEVSSSSNRPNRHCVAKCFTCGVCVDVLQLARDHRTLTDVLHGRNLRLKVSLTLWRRSIGELLTYLLRCV